MFGIEAGNIIKVTRGDTLPLTATLTKGDGVYTPVSGDSIRFALSTGYKGAEQLPTDSDKGNPNRYIVLCTERRGNTESYQSEVQL